MPPTCRPRSRPSWPDRSAPSRPHGGRPATGGSVRGASLVRTAESRGRRHRVAENPPQGSRPRVDEKGGEPLTFRNVVVFRGKEELTSEREQRYCQGAAADGFRA